MKHFNPELPGLSVRCIIPNRTNTRDTSFRMTLCANTNHEAALAAFIAAGHTLPELPAGRKTVWHHFTTVEGQYAIIINQGGFDRLALEEGENANGCILVVVLDEVEEETARGVLEEWILQMLLA